MTFRHALALLMTVWAVSSMAADIPAGNPAQTTIAAINQPSKNATNDIIELPVLGKNYTNSIGMALIPVPGGFWAGKYEVTQKEYEKVMGSNPSAFRGDQRPVDSVSYNDAIEFCRRLTGLEQKLKGFPEKYSYALPTEAEWQGLVAEASLDSAVTSLNGHLRQQDSEVGTKAPNAFGLYDVRGNVMEFCVGDETKAFRFLKGGSWQDRVEVNLRPEFRWYCKPDDRLNAFGIRCLLKPN